MKFIDLEAQQARIESELERRIKDVLKHARYIMGPEIGELEDCLAEFIGAKHAITCSSGTDALLMALMTFNINPGDAIFTTPFSFISTAEVIVLLKAIPVFVDIDPRTFNIDVFKLSDAIEQVLSRSHLKPRGVIPVDLFGLPADYESIMSLAQEHDLFVIEDAAQAFGATYGGRKAGALAHVGTTSFFPAKPLGCYGDGGAIFVNDDELADIIRSVRVHGKGQDKYDNVRIGINGRLDTLQAGVLLAKFSIFPEEVRLRQQVASRYNALLERDCCEVITPWVPQGCTSVWAQYSVMARDEEHRQSLQSRLEQAGIPTAIYYPKPLHLQGALSYLDHKKGDFPISEDCANRIFSLPMHPYLTLEDQERIVKVIGDT